MPLADDHSFPAVQRSLAAPNDRQATALNWEASPPLSVGQFCLPTLTLLWYTLRVVALHSDNRKEVMSVDNLTAFFLSVAASIVGYYICKWLDRNDKGDN